MQYMAEENCHASVEAELYNGVLRFKCKSLMLPEMDVRDIIYSSSWYSLEFCIISNITRSLDNKC